MNDMKKLYLPVLFSLVLFFQSAFAQPIPVDSLYLSQTPPGTTPVRFIPMLNNGCFAAERISISNDGKEIYYSIIRQYYPIAGDTIKYYKYTAGGWTGPFNLFSGYFGPGLSLTGDTLYFEGTPAGAQTFISVRNGTSWSAPRRILYGLNQAHYLQFTNSGNKYISSVPVSGLGGADWCRLITTPTDSTAVSLKLPLNNNTDNQDFFVSRDESFMIVSKAGLKISYRKTNGGWTNPKSLGAEINFGLGMWGPYVTPDNKYLFYSTGTNASYSDAGIFWVRVDGLIDSLHHTNFIPYVSNRIPDRTDTLGRFFSYTFPDSTFTDDDGNNTLTYTASLSDGSPLPSWLIFNAASRTISGTPSETGSLYVRVTATDNFSATVASVFELKVVNSVSIRKIEGETIRDYKLYQNYPNPFNPSTNIRFAVPKSGYVSVKVYNLLGREMETLAGGSMNAGVYETEWKAGGYASGVYYCRIETEGYIDVIKMILMK